MNIAFTSLVLLVFLIPGIIFSRFYYSGEFSKEYFKPSLFELLLSTFIPTFFLQSLWVELLQLIGYNIDYQLLLTLAMGPKNEEELRFLAEYFSNNIAKAYWYNITLWFFSALSGYGFKLFIRKTKLDRKTRFFRFKNEFHYLISGEILDFYDVPGEAHQVDFVYIDILTESPEGSIIYSGILYNYVLSKAGGVETIYLQDAKRTFLNKQGERSQEDYQLPGRLLVLPYSKVENMHITYYEVIPDEPEPPRNTLPLSEKEVADEINAPQTSSKESPLQSEG